MKLVSVTLPDTKPPMLAHIRTITCAQPYDNVIGWSILVRGPAVILVANPDHIGERKMYEFARSSCVLVWSTNDIGDADKIQKYDSAPLVRVLATADAEQAETPLVDAKPAAQGGKR